MTSLKNRKFTNSMGFSHTLILPVIVAFIVGAIGTYTVMRTNAATSVPGICKRMGTPVIGRGNQGECTKVLQKSLNRWRPSLSLSADGVFGTRTQTAVKAFQKAHGLTADGVVGQATWAKVRPYRCQGGTCLGETYAASSSSTSARLYTAQRGCKFVAPQYLSTRPEKPRGCYTDRKVTTKARADSYNRSSAAEWQKYQNALRAHNSRINLN